MRLFVAVELPEAVRRSVAELAADARRRLPPASWVRAENLHLTLRFLGEVDGERLGALRDALATAGAAQRSFVAATAAVGTFPERGPVRVLWLGLDPAAAIFELAGRVEEALSAAGFPPDGKAFRAHVTLARARTPWPSSTRRELERLAMPAQAFALAELVLFESELAPNGARYRARARLSLAEAA